MNQERIFTVLREPHITEKVSVQGEIANQYAFKVAPDATKTEIRTAVESIFSVRDQGHDSECERQAEAHRSRYVAQKELEKSIRHCSCGPRARLHGGGIRVRHGCCKDKANLSWASICRQGCRFRAA